MQCNQCGYYLDPLDVACPRCSRLAQTQPLFSPNIAPPADIQIVRQENGNVYKVCPQCQVSMDTRLRNCVQCGFAFPFGSPLNVAQPALQFQFSASDFRPSALSKSKQQTIEALIILAAVIGIFACVGVLIVALSPRKSGNSAAFLSPGGASLVSMTERKDIDSRLIRASATTGVDLEVSLAWNSTTDLDLEVVDPSGEKIWAKHKRSLSGGVFDVDANPTLVTKEGTLIADSGGNPGPANIQPLPEYLVDIDTKLKSPDPTGPFEGLIDPLSGLAGSKILHKFTRKPVEHIYFSNPPKGVYSIHVSCYSWREPNQNPLPCVLDIRSHGIVMKHLNGTMGPANYIDNNLKYVEAYKYTVP